MVDGNHLPRHLQDRLAAGLLEPEERRRVEAHLAGCEACRRIHAGLVLERQAFLDRHPPRERVAALLARPPSAARIAWRPVAWAAAAAAAVGLVVIASWPGEVPPDLRDAGPAVVFKGGARLSYRVKRAGASRTELGEGDLLARAGDAIQLRVDPPRGLDHVTVFSMDSDGDLQSLLAVEVQRPTDLPRSLVVDESDDRPQRLFVLFTAAPVELESVVRSGRAAFEQAHRAIAGLERFRVAVEGPQLMESILVRTNEVPTRAPPDVPPER